MRPSRQSVSRRLPRRRSDPGQHDQRPKAIVFVRPSLALPRQARRPSGAAAVAIRARLAGSARWTAAVVGSCLPAQSSEHAEDARHGRALRRMRKSPACSQPTGQIPGRAPGTVRAAVFENGLIRASPAELGEGRRCAQRACAWTPSPAAGRFEKRRPEPRPQRDANSGPPFPISRPIFTAND